MMKDIHSVGRLLIVGLDGADWKIIDPLIQDGQLPHLSRLVHQGSWGPLQSLEPMISTMLWTSISSGKRPDKHGVRDFAVTSKAVRCKRVWDIVAQFGFTAGVYGHMITWPPDPIKGFMIPGTFALGPDTHPPDYAFLRKLAMEEASGNKGSLLEYFAYGRRALRKGVRCRTLTQLAAHLFKDRLGKVKPLDNFYRKRLLKLRLDGDVFCYLCRQFKPQLAYFYTHLLDSSQHLFWRYREPEAFRDVNTADVEHYGDVISDAYREVDRAVGQILSNLGDDLTVVVVSDHGGQASPVGQAPSAFTIKTEKLLKILNIWDQVRAVNIGFELFLCPKREQAGAMDTIRRAFEEVVTDHESGKVFTVTPREYSYLQVQIDRNRVQQLKGKNVRIGNRSYPFEEVVEVASSRMSGTHHPTGIFILWGRHIRPGVEIQGASILDITPTVLMLMGLPLAEDMDGRAWQEVVEPSFLKDHPLNYLPTYEDQDRTAESEDDVAMPEELAEKLRALGYLG